MYVDKYFFWMLCLGLGLLVGITGVNYYEDFFGSPVDCNPTAIETTGTLPPEKMTFMSIEEIWKEVGCQPFAIDLVCEKKVEQWMGEYFQ